MGGYSVYSLYVYFKFHTFDGSRIVIGGDSMVFSSADSMCYKWSNVIFLHSSFYFVKTYPY